MDWINSFDMKPSQWLYIKQKTTKYSIIGNVTPQIYSTTHFLTTKEPFPASLKLFKLKMHFNEHKNNFPTSSIHRSFFLSSNDIKNNFRYLILIFLRLKRIFIFLKLSLSARNFLFFHTMACFFLFISVCLLFFLL